MEEGRVLIDLYQSLTDLVNSTLRSEVNGVTPGLFTEKEPSAIQPFINQAEFSFVLDIAAEIQRLV